MEEKIKEIVEQAIKCKARILDIRGKFVTFEMFKQLPVAGDIIECDFKRYVVVRREFNTDHTDYSWEHNNSDVLVIVECITKDEE